MQSSEVLEFLNNRKINMKLIGRDFTLEEAERICLPWVYFLEFSKSIQINREMISWNQFYKALEQKDIWGTTLN